MLLFAVSRSAYESSCREFRFAISNRGFCQLHRHGEYLRTFNPPHGLARAIHYAKHLVAEPVAA